ncbi:MAG: cohesin domain-containing protein [Porcipelethomonas sp.]
MNIKKKLIAISLICAMSLSAVACADNDNSENSGNAAANGQIKVQETFSSEEVEQLMKHELEFTPVTDGEDGQDAVEQIIGGETGGDSQAANNNGSQNGNSSDSQSGANGGSQNGNSSDSQSGNNAGDSSSLIDIEEIESTDTIFVPGDDSQGSENPSDNQNGSETPAAGKTETYQVFWMDLSKKKDFVFDGEYITATFKIKEDAPNGTYPITIEWMDFANYEGKTISGMTGVDGSVVVGSEAVPNSFKNGGNFEIMAENVSGNPGDTVTVKFDVKNNPGFVACLFRFGYNSDVLEFVKGKTGSDFLNCNK